MNLSRLYDQKLKLSAYVNNALIPLITLLFVFNGYAHTQASSGPFPILKGLPGITHYSRTDFHADPQFWAVCEDKNGILYFGNNDGAIIFDGERWYQVNLPNNSSIRCLTTDQSGNVYAGGFNEFGLIKKDDAGRYYYESLLDTLKFQDKDIENLWQVHALKEKVIYRSFSKLIILEGNKVTKLPAKSAFTRSFIVNGQYYVQDEEEGIFLLDLMKMQFIPSFPSEVFDNEEIVSILPTDNPNRVLASAKSGKIYLLDLYSRTANIWKNIFSTSGKDLIECAIQAKDSLYYFGTLSSGIIILDKNGEAYNEEQKREGLQDKTVLGLFQNKKGNIWALLNNGLDCINLTSPVTTLFEDASLYDVLIEETDKMYLATNQGVFFAESIEKNLPEFIKIEGLEGQSWTLQKIEGDLLVGHDKGLFQIKEGKAIKIGNFSGIWKVIPIKEKENTYFAAGYAGLYVIKRTLSGEWMSLGKIAGFEESSRDILESETPGTYWVCHGYKGVFRIKIDDDLQRVTSLEHFTTQNGFPFPFNINIFKWEGQTVFTTNYGIYTFDSNKSGFIPYAPLNNILDSTKNTRKILQYENKTWFVQDDEVGFFVTDTIAPTLETDYFLQFKGTFNRGMECIIPIENNQVLLGTKTGLYLFDLDYKNDTKEVPTNITNVVYTSNQEMAWLPISPKSSNPIGLPNTTSILRFEFAAPGLQNDASVQYAYMLEGIDEYWSAWQGSSSTEFNYLRPGTYTFKVKSRSLLGMMGQEAIYKFEILPFWYQTWWAWLFYILFFGLFITLLVHLINRKIKVENDKAREEERKARRLLELELQQMKLKSEKEKISQDKILLEEDVLFKTKELANYTMMLVKKREVIAALRQDLKEFRAFAKSEESRRKVREMTAKISRHMTNEEHLQVFEANFERVHQDFFIKLRTLFPDLTQRELHLCAFVKMNLTNKEISPMLNISVRGVETARYRIRKKLNLEFEHNLVEYLENLSSESAIKLVHDTPTQD